MTEQGAQAVYNKLVEIQSYIVIIVDLGRDLACNPAIVKLEQANPFTKLTPSFDKLMQTLLAAKDDQLYALRAGATHSYIESAAVIKTEDDANVEVPTLIDPAAVVMSKFELSLLEIKTRCLQKLLSCRGEPANTGLQNDSTVVEAVFRLIPPKEKKALLKRLLDMYCAR